MSAAAPIANLLVIRSPNIDRAATFYRAMGLSLTKHQHGKGPEHYASEANGFVFEIYPLGQSAPTTSTRIGLSIIDVDAIVKLLVIAGGELVSAPADSEWGRRAVMKDLDGHTVELLSRPADENLPRT